MRLLNWAFPVIMLSEAECKNIMVPVVTNILLKLQVMRRIKRNVVAGSVHSQGMDFKNIYTTMEATHPSLLITFYDTDTNIEHLLQTSLDYLAMDMGLLK